MSEFIDRQAEESDRDSTDDEAEGSRQGGAANSDNGSKSGRSAANSGEESDGGPVAKKRKVDKKKRDKKKKRVVESSDEEEDDIEEDEDKAKEEMKGFIASDDEIEEEGDDAGGDSKSEKSNEDEDDDLADDLDLLRENQGMDKKTRVHISDSDSDEDDMTKIGKKLFGDNEDDGERSERGNDDRREDYSDRSDEDSEDDFIVQEQGHRKRRHRERNANIPAGALDDAREIFGVSDFNFDDFYEDEEGIEEGDLEDEEEEVIEEDDEGQEIRVRRPKTRGKKSTLYDTLDPTELEKGFMSATDKRIMIEDLPERFQTRRIPVIEATDEEIAQEAAWILKYAFKEHTITTQIECEATRKLREAQFQRNYDIEQQVLGAIRAALQFLRAKGKENYEVPFIYCYRKEAIKDLNTNQDILTLDDLWRVYEYDEKWCHLNSRKVKFIELMKRMQLFIQEVAQHEYVYREISSEDIQLAERIDSIEKLIDMNAQFQMYYGNEISRMLEWEKAKETLAAIEEGGDDAIFTAVSAHYKLSTRNDKFQTCVNNGIGQMVQKFGLTASQVAENLEWRKHEIEQEQVSPRLVAEELCTPVFTDPEMVINAAVFMMAKEISRHPQVREFVRRIYRDRVFINAKPTKKGREQFDENSPIYEKRYLKEKPIAMFENDEYLYFHQLVNAGLMELMFGCDRDGMGRGNSLMDTILQEQPFKKDEFSDVVEEWNVLRDKALHMAIKEMLLPYLETETKQKMLEEAQEAVTRKCSLHIKSKLKTASFVPSDEILEEDTEDLKRKGEIRVMAIVYSTDPKEASFGALVNEDGVVTEFIKLQHFTKRKFGPPDHVNNKRETMLEFEKFFVRNRPHLIVLCAEDMEALRLKRDLEESLADIRSNFQSGKDKITINNVPEVYLMDNEPAKIFATSKLSMTEFSDFPDLLKQAICLARLALDPLPVYSWLWNAEDDILCLKMAPLQSEVDKESLKWAVAKEIISQVNAVGVDLNKCLEYNHYANTLQFIAGLGPRKAAYILKILKQNDNLIESRSKLVMTCKLGPKVFMNCSGFIRLDTAKISERTEAYVEVLDGTRIHPETYEWARKMAVDALEVDDSSDPTSALIDIMEAPERLKKHAFSKLSKMKFWDLDLDAFAEELKRQGYGEKKATLYDISNELNNRFKDPREPLVHMSNSELFDLFNRGIKPLKVRQLLKGVVVNVQYSNKKKPQELPIAYMADDSYFHCPRCKVFKATNPTDVKDHLEISNVRMGGCPGDPVGIRVRLDNGIVGFVPIQMISRDRIENPLDRVQPNQTVSCVVTDIDKDRFSYKLSTRSTDLMDASRGGEDRDRYFDLEAFENDEAELKDASERKKKATSYVRRVIKHPSFFNVGYADAERMLAKMDPGEAIIRPSSKSADKLTITWKVADGVLNNVEVDELEKDNVFSRGRRFRIGSEDFEDFDEMLTRYIQPMATYANEVMTHKCYLQDHYFERDKEPIEMRLIDERRANPSRIPYVFSVSRDYPGKFILSYYVSGRCRHEYFSMTPDGMKFRQTLFKSLERMMGWFKANYRQPPPGVRGGGYR
ncbi:hypothetical protein WR25_12833 [Diploscapter pachys]|uniref:Suppressor of Ty 6 homolog n=1 Tax=Diploscapter pachys TaxID=2018661 RepID=A0A2A2JB40_9BILA|nr:hypothetical protein WR25_12833 [Diploscapter pachys]